MDTDNIQAENLPNSTTRSYTKPDEEYHIQIKYKTFSNNKPQISQNFQIKIHTKIRVLRLQITSK